MLSLHGKTALVTGGGRGIGKGCAVQLAAGGADIVLNDVPDSADLEPTAAEIRALGRNAFVVRGDAFSREGCESILGEALRVAAQVDILVSCPSYSRRARFLEYTAEM